MSRKKELNNRLSSNPVTNKLILSALICVLLLLSTYQLINLSTPAYAAGLEISVDGGDWDLGATPADKEKSTTDKWTVHTSRDGTEDIDVQVSDANGWTASDTEVNGKNIFCLKETHENKIIKSSEPVRWKEDAASGDHPFDLWFKAPSSSTPAGQHTLTVTLTASGWVMVCNTCAECFDGEYCGETAPHRCTPLPDVDCTYCNTNYGYSSYTGYSEHGACAMCKSCNDGVCVNTPEGQKDTSGVETCVATHYRCDGAGACVAPHIPCAGPCVPDGGAGPQTCDGYMCSGCDSVGQAPSGIDSYNDASCTDWEYGSHFPIPCGYWIVGGRGYYRALCWDWKYD